MPGKGNVVITGNLTTDPELRSTPSGTSVCNLRIACNTRRKDGEEWVDKPNFFNVTVWGAQGENAARYPKLVQRELAEGHEVGNHSFTHPDLAKMSDEAVRSEIQKTQDAIINASGYKPILMRPPYGAMTPKQRLWVSHEWGFKIILWEVDPLDWKEPGPEVVASRIISAVRPAAYTTRGQARPA